MTPEEARSHLTGLKNSTSIGGTRVLEALKDAITTIAAQTWEYNNQYRPAGEPRWRTQKWEPTPELARTHRPYLWADDPEGVDYRLVRRPVGPVEVVEG